MRDRICFLQSARQKITLKLWKKTQFSLNKRIFKICLSTYYFYWPRDSKENEHFLSKMSLTLQVWLEEIGTSRTKGQSGPHYVRTRTTYTIITGISKITKFKIIRIWPILDKKKYFLKWNISCKQFVLKKTFLKIK